MLYDEIRLLSISNWPNFIIGRFHKSTRPTDREESVGDNQVVDLFLTTLVVKSLVSIIGYDNIEELVYSAVHTMTR